MRGFGQSLVGGLIVCATVALPGAARADGTTTGSGKGIVGGGLLGAEAVMLTQAAAGVRPGWAYAVGGGLGAAAGAVGGHFADTDSAKLSVYLLVGGMVLAIPTTVAVLSATSYEPVNYVEDRPPVDEPVAEPASGAPSTPAPAPAPVTQPTSRARIHHTAPIAAAPKAPPAIVGLAQGTVTVSVPAVEVRHMYTRTEIAELGIKQRTEVAIPLLNVVF